MYKLYLVHVNTVKKLARALVSQQAGSQSKCWCWVLFNEAVPHTPPQPNSPSSCRANSRHYDDKVPWRLQSPKFTQRPHSSSAFCHHLDRCMLSGHEIGFELILPLKKMQPSSLTQWINVSRFIGKEICPTWHFLIYLYLQMHKNTISSSLTLCLDRLISFV